VTPAVTAGDLAQLAACWRSIGLRGATIEWELDRPAQLSGSLAMRLRSALGPALAAGGARSGTLCSIPGDGRPPALWFRGWSCPRQPVRRVRAELRCVGAVADDLPALRHALGRLRLPPTGGYGALAQAIDCSVVWHGTPAGGDSFGPPLVPSGDVAVAAGACRVEAVSPLHLTTGGRMVVDAPPLHVLVRSAGERLHQLGMHWGVGAEALPPVVGRAYRESQTARLAWAEVTRPAQVARRSSSTGQTQLLRGICGAFEYEGVSPLALTMLALGAEAGVGKDTAFGCGQLRVSVAEGP
jgi:hypothetical protein